MQPIETCKVVLREEPFTSLGCFIDVGLLSENHHKINLIAGEDLL